MPKKLTVSQKAKLKKHSAVHTSKHMASMRKLMKAGNSFSSAHKKTKGK